MAIIETLLDLLSAASGALVGAIVTALFNRGKRRELSNQVVLGRQALAKMQAENERLLAVVQDRENTIMEMQMRILKNESRQNTPDPIIVDAATQATNPATKTNAKSATKTKTTSATKKSKTTTRRK